MVMQAARTTLEVYFDGDHCSDAASKVRVA
jgi:hypothetical protein